ncbi:hypothetical protein [Sinomonas sp. ASV322]|uniref:hypothetical protein n=1 Tax=Sinomonas sp. ASV322 TaxID=3041920 RepID=UPI0027DDA876|nr:hypothetical protein [Sinomonas sp. ASV322]MDQ4501897.1 hypothetical protein [Sinomonas sp. ASV322]
MGNSEGTGVPAVERRQVVKGAAWAVPLVAAAAAAPASAASLPPWDVGVTGSCSTGLVGVVGRAKLQFTITAVSGTVPSGTSFTLTSSEKVDLAALVSRPSAGFTVAALSETSALVTLVASLAEGSTVTLDLLEMQMAMGVSYTFALQLNGNDRAASPSADAPDSATLSAVLRTNVGGTTLVRPSGP